MTNGRDARSTINPQVLLISNSHRALTHPLYNADKECVETSSTFSRSPEASPWRGFGSALAVLLLSGMILMLVAHWFSNREIGFDQGQNTRPRVTHVRPADGETNVMPDAAVAIDIRLPSKDSADAKVIGADAATLGGLSLTSAGVRVDAAVNVSAAGDALTISPRDMLNPGTTYRVTVTPDLRDTAGKPFEPFSSTFTTATNVQPRQFPAAFSHTPLQNVTATNRVYTCVTFGPDNRLYAGTFSGEIVRFDINPDGTLTNQAVLRTLQAHFKGPRLILGIAFDPKSTPDAPRLIVSHGQMVPPNEQGQIIGAQDFSGAITLLTGSQLDAAQDLVVGLPRGYKDHLNFQPAFGPDGAIYFNQGSHTSVGSPDNKWGQRPERLLTAAILRLDLSKLKNPPVDTNTDAGKYDPASPDAPLTIYATGVRSGFDILFHSNGTMYCSVNGAAAGGNLPERPADEARPQPYRAMLNRIDELDHTTDDILIAIQKGKYYGHPNPRRGQYVLNGGNPTAGVDPFEVPQYPTKTLPEPDYELPLYSFGKNRSPNGMVEYTSDAFGPALKGAIIVARFSAGGDLIALFPNPDGSVARVVTGITGFRGFTQPLDIALDPRTGNLYVAEFGTMGITLLRPLPGELSTVFEQVVGK